MGTTPNLQRKLQQTLGAEAAGDLVTWMQGMDANRSEMSDLRRDVRAMQSDLAELRREMQVGFARVDGRFDAMWANTERLVEKALREQTRFFFLAWSVLLAAIIGLYART